MKESLTDNFVIVTIACIVMFLLFSYVMAEFTIWSENKKEKEDEHSEDN